jgi:hypothetical protein
MFGDTTAGWCGWFASLFGSFFPKNSMRVQTAADAVDALLAHPTNDGVVFSRAHECFYVNDQGRARKCRGLTRALRSAFFPEYDYEESRRAAALTAPARQRPAAAGKGGLLSWASVLAGRVDPTVGNRNAGLNRGKVTHEQVCDYVTLGREGFLRKYARDGIFECTHSIIEALAGWGVEPLAAEFPIYDHLLNYATSIDLVGCVRNAESPVFDQNGCPVPARRRLVLIEIKTGYGGGCFESGTHWMRLPPEVPAMVDAPMNQALLQVLMARLTLKHCYDIRDSECWVVHADKGTVRRYRMTPYLSHYEDAIYSFAHGSFNAPRSTAATSVKRKAVTTTTTKTAVAKGRRNGPATQKGGGSKKKKKTAAKGKGRKAAAATSRRKMVSAPILDARGKRTV